MRSRIFLLIIILTAVASMLSAQPALADANCDTSMHFVFPDEWVSISASKDYPQKPVVKQQLEELAARGDLAQPPSFYYAQFSIQVALKPGIAWWETFEREPIWGEDPNCPAYQKANHTCQHFIVDTLEYCQGHSNPSYRSIQTMKFFLIPDDKTQIWYRDWQKQPTVMLAYPDWWVPVTIGESGNLVGDFFGDITGLHFYYSVPLRDAYFFLPSKLPQVAKVAEIINQDDLQYISRDIDKVIPICDINAGNVPEHGYVSPIPFNYGYEDKFNLNTDIDSDPYNCNAAITMADNKIQSIDMKITDYDFDIPGTFYLGVVTKILPAISPVDLNQNEPELRPHFFEPSNIDVYQSYKSTEFTVWMIVSTPCWSGDGGCDKEMYH